MRTLISGQAGLAAVFAEPMQFRRVDGASFEGRPDDVVEFFRDCGDVAEFDLPTLEEVDRTLRHEWTVDRSMFLLFLLLDQPSRDGKDIAAALATLTADGYVLRELRRRLGSVRVPAGQRERAQAAVGGHAALEGLLNAVVRSTDDTPSTGGSRTIRIAVVGIGNCASSLVQGLEHYREGSNDDVGLLHWDLGGYRPNDIKVTAAWDVDARKVGRDLAEAVFAKPNCTAVFAPQLQATGTVVRMGAVMDGVAEHMNDHPEDRRIVVGEQEEATKADVVAELVRSGAEVLVNYLPAGSVEATRFYAECALEAGVAFVNATPTLIASDPAWARRFEQAGVAVIGDDVKAQLGATIVHRVLTDLFAKRGVKLDRTYQLSTGGSTDFLNTADDRRRAWKRIVDTEAVRSVSAEPLKEDDIHVGPSDYIPWQQGNRVSFMRMEGQLFGGVPMNLDLRLSVEDGPSSAAIAMDMIRCARIARDNGVAGVVDPASAYFCAHPRRPLGEVQAQTALDEFLRANAA